MVDTPLKQPQQQKKTYINQLCDDTGSCKE